MERTNALHAIREARAQGLQSVETLRRKAEAYLYGVDEHAMGAEWHADNLAFYGFVLEALETSR